STPTARGPAAAATPPPTDERTRGRLPPRSGWGCGRGGDQFAARFGGVVVVGADVVVGATGSPPGSEVSSQWGEMWSLGRPDRRPVRSFAAGCHPLCVDWGDGFDHQGHAHPARGAPARAHRSAAGGRRRSDTSGVAPCDAVRRLGTGDGPGPPT